MTRRIPGLAVLVVVSVALAATPALAGKAGGGKSRTPSGGASISSTASLNASPNPAAPNGTRVYLSGCGYEMKPLQIRIVHAAGYTEYLNVAMWSTGCMDNAYFLTREAGTYTIQAYQTSGTKRRATNVLKASTILTVK